MKKRFLKLYDKIIIAALLGVLSFVGCARKTYSEKQREKSESLTDSLKTNDNNFDNRIIAMYGVRPTRDIR